MTQGKQTLQVLEDASSPLAAHVLGIRSALADLDPQLREELVERAVGEVELEAGLRYVDLGDAEAARPLLQHFGTPVEHAAALRRTLPARPEEAVRPPDVTMVGCRACAKQVSVEAVFCPHCGAPRPAQARYGGRGYEYKSRITVKGWPLVHVAVGKDAQGKLRVARGVIAVGQFAVGWFTIAQFGIGFVFGLGQFVAAPIAIGQFALGLLALGQLGIGLLFGAGMLKTGLLATGLQGILDWFRGT